jgi:cytosine permease
MTAMEVGDPNFVTVMSALGLLLPAALVLLLALWTTTDNNLYSSALAFTNATKLLGGTIPKPVWTIVSVLIAIGVAFLGFASQFLSWLQIIATVTPPFGGILVTHFWAFGAIRRDPGQLQLEMPGVRVPALLAWIAASVVTYYTNVFIKPITGFVLGGVFYAVAELVARVIRRSGPEPSRMGAAS